MREAVPQVDSRHNRHLIHLVGTAALTVSEKWATTVRPATTDTELLLCYHSPVPLDSLLSLFLISTSSQFKVCSRASI